MMKKKKKVEQKELVKGSMGTASLVLGILGFFLFPFVLSTLAIIFGAIGRNRNEKYSTAGLTLGIVGFVWGIFLIALWLTIVASFFASLSLF